MNEKLQEQHVATADYEAVTAETRYEQKEEEKLRVQESQVQEIIKMLKEEFNIENNDENSEKSESKETGDTGFDETHSDDKEEEKVSSSEGIEGNDNEALSEFVGAGGELHSNSFSLGSAKLTEENVAKHNHESSEFQQSRTPTLTNFNQTEQEEEVAYGYDECKNSADKNDKTLINENEIVDENERRNYESLVEFIRKAKDFGANALDLSKKGLKKLPRQLLEMNDLQLRNNLLLELPVAGLENHSQLKSLLLENNQISRLPFEISNLASLTALNLAENPLEYPPPDVVQKGCKAVQEFMRDDYVLSRNSRNEWEANSGTPSSSLNPKPAVAYDDENEIECYDDDVWASDNEDENRPQVRSRSAHQRAGRAEIDYLKNFDFRIRSATKNLLITRTMQYDDTRYVDLKERLTRARIDANRISKNTIKLLSKRKLAQPPSDKTLFTNEKFEKAVQVGKVEKYKKTKERIDARLQKINDQFKVNEFRQGMRAEQRKWQNKRLVKGVDFVEPVYSAPFDISEDYVPVMNNEDREFYDRKIEIERMRSLSPNTLLRIEEERRKRDNYLQEKIREYTQKFLSRRGEASSSEPAYDRMEAARDLRELKAIQRELEQRRAELQFNLKAHTGGIIYRETKKLNARAKLSFVKKV